MALGNLGSAGEVVDGGKGGSGRVVGLWWHWFAFYHVSRYPGPSIWATNMRRFVSVGVVFWARVWIWGAFGAYPCRSACEMWKENDFELQGARFGWIH